LTTEISDAGRDDLDGLAQIIADAGGTGRRRALAEWELTLLAARRPALREAAGWWRTTVADIARRHTDDPYAVEALVAASDGLCVRVLLAGDPIPQEEIRATLAQALAQKA
jgi:hypothetical protein